MRWFPPPHPSDPRHRRPTHHNTAIADRTPCCRPAKNTAPAALDTDIGGLRAPSDPTGSRRLATSSCCCRRCWPATDRTCSCSPTPRNKSCCRRARSTTGLSACPTAPQCSWSSPSRLDSSTTSRCRSRRRSSDEWSPETRFFGPLTFHSEVGRDLEESKKWFHCNEMSHNIACLL